MLGGRHASPVPCSPSRHASSSCTLGLKKVSSPSALCCGSSAPVRSRTMQGHRFPSECGDDLVVYGWHLIARDLHCPWHLVRCNAAQSKRVHPVRCSTQAAASCHALTHEALHEAEVERLELARHVPVRRVKVQLRIPQMPANTHMYSVRCT